MRFWEHPKSLQKYLYFLSSQMVAGFGTMVGCICACLSLKHCNILFISMTTVSNFDFIKEYSFSIFKPLYDFTTLDIG